MRESLFSEIHSREDETNILAIRNRQAIGSSPTVGSTITNLRASLRIQALHVDPV
jgi:hypothetical protein